MDIVRVLAQTWGVSVILQEFMLEPCEVDWGQRHRAGTDPAS